LLVMALSLQWDYHTPALEKKGRYAS